MAATITQGSTVVSYAYDCEHSRISQAAPEGTTVYLGDPGSGITVEKFTGASAFQWSEYLFADGRMVGEHFTFDDASTMLRYFVADHLGSIAVLTDEVGNVAERDSYDAWGRRRNPDGSPATGTITSATTRGFTGQEHISNIGLINFNARIYDPEIGRFMSPDSVVENPYLSQMLNRYSYVGNNPLSFTDPSGNCFLGCFWNNGIFRAILAIVAAVTAQYELLPLLEGTTYAALVAGDAVGELAINAGIAGGISGYISTGRAQGGLNRRFPERGLHYHRV